MVWISKVGIVWFFCYPLVYLHGGHQEFSRDIAIVSYFMALALVLVCPAFTVMTSSGITDLDEVQGISLVTNVSCNATLPAWENTESWIILAICNFLDNLS